MTHKVNVTREGKWWMVSIPELDGLTQARRLSEAELMAKEYIAVTLDVPIESVEVEMSVQKVGDVTDIQDLLLAIMKEREQAAELERRATQQAAGLARALVAQHVPLRDVGTVLGVSHQRAHQLVSLTI
jgi:predicted RNase H-like HicB family nuclease